MANKLGDQLRRARLKAGLNQSELASKIKVSQPAISTWENGTSKPDAVTLTKLEKVLGPPITPNQQNSVVAQFQQTYLAHG